MPRASLPPTPASSTDISGKDYVSFKPETPLFSLPPSAITGRGPSFSHGATDSTGNNTGILSPTSSNDPVPARTKSSVSESVKKQQDITLPPPPTRSRKIIQMKPGGQSNIGGQSLDSTTTLSSDKGKANPSTAGKRKPATGTSAAGRKIARKTAHSIIERRRRSKMNEEFGVLKDMIPACAGQEMHKLAILQASIEYLRYLEQCVSDLKSGQSHPDAVVSSPSTPREYSASEYTPPDADASADDSDEEMTDNATSHPSPAPLENPIHHYHSTPISTTSAVSPAFSASSHHSSHRFGHIELPSSHFDTSYSHSYPQPPSGAFSVQSYTPMTPVCLSSTTSPLMLPQGTNELDHEASAALLMLNATDRRLAQPVAVPRASDAEMSAPPRSNAAMPDKRSLSGMRGMSVQDLLRS